MNSSASTFKPNVYAQRADEAIRRLESAVAGSTSDAAALRLFEARALRERRLYARAIEKAEGGLEGLRLLALDEAICARARRAEDRAAGVSS